MTCFEDGWPWQAEAETHRGLPIRTAREMIEIDLIALNDIDKTALVAEVKRNADRYNPKLLQEKFESIRSNFGEYNEVQLIGLSMQDM